MNNENLNYSYFDINPFKNKYKKITSNQVDEDKAESRRSSIKKGIPKPEEPVDELTNIKLSKKPSKQIEEPLEEPQVAKTKKPVRKVMINSLVKSVRYY